MSTQSDISQSSSQISTTARRSFSSRICCTSGNIAKTSIGFFSRCRAAAAFMVSLLFRGGAVFAVVLVLGQKFFLDRLHLVEADERVELLEGDEEVRPLDDLARLQRLLERAERVLHPLDRRRREEPRVDHDRDAELLELPCREE